MKICITGHLGFVGSETSKLLIEEGHEVIGYDLMESNNICDYQQLEAFVRLHRPSRILHLAAVARFADADKDPKLAFETNVMGTKNVVDVASKYNIPLVYSSTGSVYMPIEKEGQIKEDWSTKGNSVYGCTKNMGELYVREHTPHIILRYAHLYGKEKRMHGLIGGFADRISRGLAPTLYGGKQSNDFTYIKDVALANFKALTAPWDKWNNTYNIGTGEELTTAEAGKAICEALNWPIDKIEIKEQRTVDPNRFWFDCSKAELLLGFKAQYRFADGLKDMFNGDNTL